MNHKSSMRPVTEITIGFAATCIVHMYIVSTVIIHLYNYIYIYIYVYTCTPVSCSGCILSVRNAY